MKTGSTPVRNRATARRRRSEARNRLPAVKLSIKHAMEKVDRRDKSRWADASQVFPQGCAKNGVSATHVSDGVERCNGATWLRTTVPGRNGRSSTLHSGRLIAAGSSNVQLRFSVEPWLNSGPSSIRCVENCDS